MIYYLGFINLFAFIVCFIDKRKAIKHKWRIPENFLLFISCMGGVFGFMISMVIFHHKTKKYKFLILEPLFMIIWIIIIKEKFF